MAPTWTSGVAVLAALAVATGTLPAQPPPAKRSVLDGVYTAAQAARGEAAFEKSCTTCHSTADFSGELFLFAWSDQGIHILHDFIRGSMPEDRPGSLSREATSDIIAYILELNSFPKGEEELPSEEAALERIILESGGG